METDDKNKNKTEEKIILEGLSTETRNPETMNLDEMSSLEIVQAMNKEDCKVPKIITNLLPLISKVVDICAEALKAKNRIFYMGAGTSGRLGIVDSSECPPTFNASPNEFIGLIAGGEKAFIKAVEGAEDSEDLGREDLIKRNFCKNDICIGLAASGRTPYVIGGLKYARSIGAQTVSISCNRDAKVSKFADYPIEAIVGPEVLTGSTRLKAGTAQKLILNMISTGAMIRRGKSYQNLMVDLQMNNKKLERRGINIIKEATGVDENEAKEYIQKAKGSVKVAIVMILSNCSYENALERLSKAEGKVKVAIKNNI
jgi:N-acetylmuramic acid 6-phosphate etherase